MRARPNRFGFPLVLWSRWSMVAATWLFVVVARSGAAQEAPKTAAPGQSTLAGVYTAEQADRGQPKFEATCLGGCHNAASHRGTAFKGHWAGKSLFDLYDKIHETMPDDDPGSLSAPESAALVAYLLKYNGLPAGKVELPTEAEALKKIKIEFPASGPGPAVHKF